MDCIVHGVTKGRTQLSNFRFHFLPEILIPLLVSYSLPNCLKLFRIQYILFICYFSKLAISFWWKNINSWIHACGQADRVIALESWEGLGPQDAFKKDSRGLSWVGAETYKISPYWY